jgi:hypothetical protein
VEDKDKWEEEEGGPVLTIFFPILKWLTIPEFHRHSNQKHDGCDRNEYYSNHELLGERQSVLLTNSDPTQTRSPQRPKGRGRGPYTASKRHDISLSSAQNT